MMARDGFVSIYMVDSTGPPSIPYIGRGSALGEEAEGYSRSLAPTPAISIWVIYALDACTVHI